MSFPTERQNKLNPILRAFERLDGVLEVWQDDFDSTGIWVWLRLKMPERFADLAPIRRIKRGIQRACEEAGVSHLFLRQPERVYSTCLGEKMPEGYDDDCIKVDVYV